MDSVPEKTQELIETIRRRQSEVLTPADNIGVIAARPGQLLDQLEQYLDEDAGEQVQDMALTVPEALELEQGRQLIRRGLA